MEAFIFVADMASNLEFNRWISLHVKSNWRKREHFEARIFFLLNVFSDLLSCERMIFNSFKCKVKEMPKL